LTLQKLITEDFFENMKRGKIENKDIFNLQRWRLHWKNNPISKWFTSPEMLCEWTCLFIEKWKTWWN